MNHTFEYKMSVAILLIIWLSFCVVGLYYYRNQANYPIIFKLFKPKKIDTVKCSIASNLGTEYIVKMDLSIPYENDEQRADLMRKMPRIQSDFLMLVDQNDMERWINKSDFDALKAKLLEIVNHHSATQVKTLYFDSFNW